jgi:large subunit ribosomal protein L10
MAKSREAKTALLQKYKQLLADKGGFIAIDSKSIDNVTVTELKKQLRADGGNLTVVKNTVFKIALEEANYPTETSVFDGQTAIVTYDEDPTVIAKSLKKVQKEMKKKLDLDLLEAKYGVIEGEFITSERVMQLADIPSREELLAKLLGSMMSPVSGFMNAVTGNARGFVQVLKQLSEKGEEKAEA